ncbi:MAG: 2-oxoacid:ferredoxin oxidoreductase subunit beta, partial [Deltaproteobacteria bacterium]|nr:2-oxoacid:ferredoxin oxidoreductase subunit beta [Deltaproteobacteria bacterium]
ASFVARFSVTQPILLKEAIKEGIKKEGFSFIEVLSPCPTQFGRRNKMDKIPDVYDYIVNKIISKEDSISMNKDELKDKIITGVFVSG